MVVFKCSVVYQICMCTHAHRHTDIQYMLAAVCLSIRTTFWCGGKGFHYFGHSFISSNLDTYYIVNKWMSRWMGGDFCLTKHLQDRRARGKWTWKFMTLKEKLSQGHTCRAITQSYRSIRLCQVFVLGSPGFALQAPHRSVFPPHTFITFKSLSQT